MDKKIRIVQSTVLMLVSLMLVLTAYKSMKRQNEINEMAKIMKKQTEMLKEKDAEIEELEDKVVNITKAMDISLKAWKNCKEAALITPESVHEVVKVHDGQH